MARKSIEIPKLTIDKWMEMYNSGMSFDKIAETENSSFKIVRTRLLKAGLKPRQLAIDFSEETISDILNSYRNNESAFSISKRHNIVINTVKRLVVKNGLTWNNSPTDYKLKSGGSQINRNAFSNFDTEHELYFYGLLLADGCIMTNSNSVQLALKQTDIDIVEKFREFVGASVNVRLSLNNASFSFADKVLADKLRSVGLESRKSLREKVPSFYNLDNLNMRHFWRGFIDGDGTVNSLKDYSARLVGMIGTKEILYEFERFCAKYAGTARKVAYQNKAVNKNCYEMYYSGVDASNVARLLYSNIKVGLDRKVKQAQNLITMVDVERPVPTFDLTKRKIRKDNVSGVSGVYIRSDYVIAIITIKNKKYTKVHTYSKYGKDEAIRLSIEWRKKMEDTTRLPE